MSYNQEEYEFKITQAFSCLKDAIDIIDSLVNYFLAIPKIINKYEELAITALSKTKQLNLTDIKLESILKNFLIICELVEMINKASNTITKDYQFFSKALYDCTNTVNKLKEGGVHLLSAGEDIAEYITSLLYSHDQHEPLLFEAHIPNSTSTIIEEYKLIGSNVHLPAIEV